MDLSELEFPAHNAIFHITKGLLFNRNISFQVKFLYDDQNNRNIPIQNKRRLKERLFEKIKNLYNARLRANTESSPYRFKEEYQRKMLIHDDEIDKLSIKKFLLTKGMEDESGISDHGGVYGIYPRTLVCERCGDVQYLNNNNFRTFDPQHCKRDGCDGKYEQLSVMMYCEICGKIEPFYYTYEDYPITLHRPSKDSISTWKVKAETPERDYLDFFRLQCNHKDPHDMGSYRHREVISNADPKKMRPLTVTEGSIFIPVADVSIDIPTSPDIDMDDLEYILLGIHLGKFSFLESLELGVNLKVIQDFYEGYHNESQKKRTFKTRPNYIGKSKEEKEQMWMEENFIDKFEDTIDDLKDLFQDKESLREINDFAALLGKLGLERLETLTYNEYLNSLTDDIKKKSKRQEFNSIKNKYSIANIIYVPQVTLINSCYGIIHGVNKFYEAGFIPHFEPIWKKRTDPHEGFEAYSYPYNTEGIIFTLDKAKICSWLYQCEKIHTLPDTEQDISDFFSKLRRDMYQEAFDAVKKLLHTLSHLLMRNSSVYTGLDLQSYGEKIFPSSASIFLFTTSSINIGGLQFIFENEIFNWFENIQFDIKECTLDPNCISESGSCFSCMYVPEFVCSYFNKDLDRDTFIGKYRYNKGFWW